MAKSRTIDPTGSPSKAVASGSAVRGALKHTHEIASDDEMLETARDSSGGLEAMEVIKKIGAFADGKNKRKHGKVLQGLRQNAAEHEQSVKKETSALRQALEAKYAEFKAIDDDLNETLAGDMGDLIRCCNELKMHILACHDAVTGIAQDATKTMVGHREQLTAAHQTGGQLVEKLEHKMQAKKAQSK